MHFSDRIEGLTGNQHWLTPKKGVILLTFLSTLVGMHPKRNLA
jgi:hypothetical protein